MDGPSFTPPSCVKARASSLGDGNSAKTKMERILQDKMKDLTGGILQSVAQLAFAFFVHQRNYTASPM